MGNPHVFYRLGFLSEEIIQDVVDAAIREHDNHGEQSVIYGTDGYAFRSLVAKVGDVSSAMDTSVREEKLRESLVTCGSVILSWIAKLDSPGNNSPNYNHIRYLSGSYDYNISDEY